MPFSALNHARTFIHRVVQWQLNKRQQGTHQAKSRGEINRTTKKLGNQKGGGTARHGSRKSGIFVGGGKAFGPRFRSHETALNKKIRALGLRHALSSKVKTSDLIIIDKAELKDAKTKAVKAAFEKLGLANALIIDGAARERRFREGCPQCGQHRCAAGAGHQCVRHSPPQEPGSDQGRG